MEDWLAARTNASPHALALIIGENHWSYAELDNLVNDSASRLAGMVQPGQHVGILMPNNLAYVCLIHALARIGAVLVPLNLRLTNHELAWQLDHSNCALLVIDDEMVGKFPKFSGSGRHLLLARDLFDPPNSEKGIPKTIFRLENPQAIVFTSGTTGRPKGAVLTFANHFWSATSSAFRLGLQKDDRWLSCLPLYHVGGLAVILRSCLYGTAVVLHNRFDELAISDSLDSQMITHISLVPVMALRLLDFRGDRPWPSSLRHLLLGGAAAPTNLFKRCQELDIPISATYGLTEAASQVATILPQQTRNKPGSVGKPLLFTSVDIIDGQDQSLPAGSVGEIRVSGPTVMAGYYQDEQATKEILHDGRLYTGDIGYLDEEGDLWLVQRRNDIIISGGENVYPSEVENVLLQHPSVAAICVVGISDPQWGQRVAAMVRQNRGTSLTKDELLQFGRKNLAGYKLPRVIHFADQLPLTASGKIHRRLVAEQLKQFSQQVASDKIVTDSTLK
jgi:O-succinylbenzoic acid--CoA ligase